MGMKLNGLNLVGYFMDGVRPCFELECQIEDACELDGQALTVTEDGETVEEFFGYRIDVINRSSGGTYFVYFARELDDASKEAISQLEESVKQLHGSVNEANETAAAAEESAKRAEESASQAGTDMQTKTAARLALAAVPFADVTATDVVAIPDYIPEWDDCIGKSMKQNDPVKRSGTIYRCSQDLTVQEQYPPETAGESQYYPIEVAADGIIVYRECHGDYDMVHKGEKRHYPGADGTVYTAIEDTSYSPDAYPKHWKADGEEAA